ncbi:hypothetical protein CAEBREN_05784 [Caenorhabditis brenneri]|uniref:SCP domain-containing protein n=1 Tax=Caenorhabditis brenneri TaxID=135651 RepID=G0MR09_CAEBE|nr:hypothetical protein CAEBREN_05784 [Caenorhabditis brenneri]
MKLLFMLLGILVLWTVPSTAVKTLGWESIPDKDGYLKKINDERRAYAKKAKIPNMRKLYWDSFLETKAQVEDYGGDKKTCRHLYRDGDDATADRVKKFMDSWFPREHRKEFIGIYNKDRMNGFEEMTPHQQKIGCAPAVTSYDTDDGGKNVFKTLCFIQPEITGDSWNQPVGEPGSACGEGYKNDDGLCDPIVKPTATSSTGGGSTSSAQTSEQTSAKNNTVAADNSSRTISLMMIIGILVAIKFL